MELRFPFLLRCAGVVAIVHAAFGLVLGVGSLVLLPQIDPSTLSEKNLRESLAAMPEEMRKEASEFDFSIMPRIMASRTFRSFFYGMAILGAIFNASLIFLGYLLFQKRPKAVAAFVGVMVTYALYSHLLPRLIPFQSEWALSFAAAWGVGNMGLSLMLLTYFWVWGPVLAVAGRLTKRLHPTGSAGPL